MSAGCSIADVLMPDEYKSVMVVSFPGMTQFLTVDIVREEFERYGDITHIEMFHYNKNKQRNWGKVTFETTNQAENAVAESQEEEIIALPTGNARLQNEHRHTQQTLLLVFPVLLNSGIVHFFHLYTLFVWELTRDQYVVLLR
jgi:hypothetical protein